MFYFNFANCLNRLRRSCKAATMPAFYLPCCGIQVAVDKLAGQSVNGRLAKCAQVRTAWSSLACFHQAELSSKHTCQKKLGICFICSYSLFAAALNIYGKKRVSDNC